MEGAPAETHDDDSSFEVIDTGHDPAHITTSIGWSQTPAGPRADPVFPSLPADGHDNVELPPEYDAAIMSPLFRNVFALTAATDRELPGRDSGGNGPQYSVYPEDFSAPENERIAQMAVVFVKYHVRVIKVDLAIKETHRHFAVGTIVLSEDRVPTSTMHHASFVWAINDGQVVELKNVRLPVGHLAPYQLPAATNEERLWPGHLSGLAVFTAKLVELLDLETTTQIAAIGDIAFTTNAVATVSNIDPFLERVQESDHLDELLIPFGNGRQTGMHDKVRYWSVRDTNEAAYAILSMMSGEVVIPNLRRRALTKQAYSWFSLGFALLAVLAYQFAAWSNVGEEPPVDFLKVILVLVVLFVIGSEIFTHGYWRRDR